MSEFTRDDDDRVVPLFGVGGTAKKPRGRPRKKRGHYIAPFSTLFSMDNDEGRGSPEELMLLNELRDNRHEAKRDFLVYCKGIKAPLAEVEVTEVNLIPGVNGAPIMAEVRYKAKNRPKNFVYLIRVESSEFVSEQENRYIPVFIDEWGYLAERGMLPFYGIPELVEAVKQTWTDHTTVTVFIAEGIHAVQGVRARLAHKDNVKIVEEYEREHNTKIVVIGWVCGLKGAQDTNWEIEPPDYIGAYPKINDFKFDLTDACIRAVHLVPDVDTAGIIETDEVARQLKLRGFDRNKLFRVEWPPNIPLEKTGWDDRNELPKGVKENARLEQLLHPPLYERRPTIFVNESKLFEVVSAAEQELRESGEYYQRGDEVVYIGEIRTITHGKRGATSQRVFTASEHKIVDDLSRFVRFEALDKKTNKIAPVKPPRDIAQMIMARRGNRKLPPLTAVIDRPTITKDGAIVVAQGYNAETGLFLDFDAEDYPAIPENPTRDDALKALQTLKELCPEFPFVTPADKSVYLAGLLTSACREALQGAPAFGFSAIKARTGKSKLATTMHMLMSSCSVAVLGWTLKEEESEKRLDMALLTGATCIAIDNINGVVNSSKLCMMITQPVVKIRDFGTLRSGPEVPSVATITLTGNGLRLTDDLAQRVLVCRLDANVDCPEKRTFTSIDPVKQIKADRGKFVMAALTILRAFKIKNEAFTVPAWDSDGLADWNDWVRGALLWLGEPDPLDTMQLTREEDPKQQTRRKMFEGLELAFGVNVPFSAAKVAVKMKVRERIPMLNRDGTPMMSTTGVPPNEIETPMMEEGDFLHLGLREACLEVAGEKSGEVNTTRLSIWLRENVGQAIGEGPSWRKLVLDEHKAHGSATQWRLKAEDGYAPLTPSGEAAQPSGCPF